jgi:hypothetical protein
MKHGIILIALISAWNTMAQPVVKVTVSSDTIELEETVEVTYTIENGEGQFVMPDMDDLPVISGPNSSSSFMYQNGKMSSSQSYSFSLMAAEEGKIIIPATSYKTGDEKLMINPVEIIVLNQNYKPTMPKKNQETIKPTTTREKKKI